MRISDWSSDVCSSDLLVGGHARQAECDVVSGKLEIDVVGVIVERRIKEGEIGGDFIKATVHPIIGGQDRVGRIRPVVSGLPHMDEGADIERSAAGSMDEKIGRASCRSRVCKKG